MERILRSGVAGIGEEALHPALELENEDSESQPQQTTRRLVYEEPQGRLPQPQEPSAQQVEWGSQLRWSGPRCGRRDLRWTRKERWPGGQRNVPLADSPREPRWAEER